MAWWIVDAGKARESLEQVARSLVGALMMVILKLHTFFTKTVLWAGAASIGLAAIANINIGEVGTVFEMILFEAPIASVSIYGLRTPNPQIMQLLKS